VQFTCSIYLFRSSRLKLFGRFYTNQVCTDFHTRAITKVQHTAHARPYAWRDRVETCVSCESDIHLESCMCVSRLAWLYRELIQF
ncbi:hypothetical protein C0J52_19275, partial [Blattella germanica]